MSAMQVNIDGPQGRLRVTCYGLFNIQLNGLTFLFMLNDWPGHNKLAVSEYYSGLRWPVELELATGTELGLVSPADESSEAFQSVIAHVRQKIASDIIKRSEIVGGTGPRTEEDVAKIILNMQKRHKTNEMDF